MPLHLNIKVSVRSDFDGKYSNSSQKFGNIFFIHFFYKFSIIEMDNTMGHFFISYFLCEKGFKLPSYLMKLSL